MRFAKEKSAQVLNLITYLHLVLRLPVNELYLYFPTSCHNVVLKNGVKYTFITSTIIFKVLNLAMTIIEFCHSNLMTIFVYNGPYFDWCVIYFKL